MVIVTAGNKYTDIDALSSCYAYKRLMDLKGIAAKCVLPGTRNETITKTIRSWNIPYDKKLPNKREQLDYVLIDVSNPKYFSDFVNQNRINELYDHHFGFEDYWKKRLKDKSSIEVIGACATQIWEKYKKETLHTKIDSLTANLLYTTIFAHTLNFKVSVFTDRDKQAFNEIKPYTNLPPNWTKRYFNELEESVISNPLASMKNDTKTQNINGKRFFIVQLELWNSKKFVENNKKVINDYLHTSNEDYAFFTSPSISEGKNYLITRDRKTKRLLFSTLNAKFNNGVGATNYIILRKEIIKKLLDK